MKGLTKKSVLAFLMALVLFVSNFGNVSLTARAAEDGTGLVAKRTIKMNGAILTDSTMVYKDDVMDVRYDLIDLMPGTNIVQGETYEVAIPSNLLIASAMNWDAEIDGKVLCNCHYNNSTGKIEVVFADSIFDGSYAGGIQDAYIGFYASVDGSGKNAGDSIVISGPAGTADDTTVFYGGDAVPTNASVAKTGAFVDEPSKIIEWTVTVAEGPNGETALVVKDTLSANQQMVTGSFTVDGAAAEPSVSGQNLTYTLSIENPMPNKQHIIKYRTVAYAIQQDGSEYNVIEGDPLKIEAVNAASVHADENGPALDTANYNVSCDFGKVKWLEKKSLGVKAVPGSPSDRYVTWQVKVHTADYTFTNVVLHDEITAAVIGGSELTYIWESFRMVNDATGAAVPGAALSGSPVFDGTGKCAWETSVIPSLEPGDYTITYDVKITDYANYKKNNSNNTKMGNSAWATYDKVTASGTPGFGPGKTPVITVDAGDVATGQASLSKYLPEVHYSYDVSERGAEVHGLPWMISVNADREMLTTDYNLVEIVGGWSTDAKKLPQHVASTTDKTQVIFDVEVDDIAATPEQYAQIQIEPFVWDASGILITFGNLLAEGHKVTFRFQTYIDETEKDYYEGHHMTDDSVRIAYNDVVLRNGQEELIWKDASIWAYTQVLKKEFVSYDYDKHLAAWKLEFNRDMMELKDAVITDALQTGTLDHVELVKHALDSYVESYGTRYTLTDDAANDVYYTYDGASKEVAIHFGDVPRKQTYTVYIYEKIDPTDKVMDGGMEKSLATYNGTINISNTATLTKDGSAPVVAQADGIIDNKLMDKSAQIVSKGKATYTIYMNQGRMTWPQGAKISDIMSAGLMPDLSSYKMYKADVAADGTMTKASEVETGKFDVSVKVLEADNAEGAAEGSVKTTITIPEDAVNEAYIITYDVFVDQAYAGLDGITFNNTVTVDGKKNDGILASEDIALSQLMGYGSGSLSYSTVKVVKQNVNGEALKGAEFDLVYNEQVVNSGVTDENGEIEFSNLTPGFSYTLVETKAPDNYLKAENVTFTAPARGDSSMIDSPILVIDDFDPDSVKISIPVSKVWLGSPADKAVIELKVGDDFVDELTLTAANQWSGSFDNLKKYDENGQEITYSISEVTIPGYTSDISGDAETGFTVTNTELISIPVTKEWIGTAAASVTVKLLADGSEADTLTLTAADQWSGSFADLRKYDAADGHEIEYTLEEVSVDGYSSVITGDAATGFTVTNTIEGKVSVGVTKKWVGPAAEKAVVRLRANGVEQETFELNEANNWQHTFAGLDKYKNGVEVSYTVEETSLAGYSSVVTGSAAAGYVVTNTNDAKISIPVTKEWIGTAAASVTVKLLADGSEADTLTLTAADQWSGSFANLRKYDAADGHEIEYTLEEVSIDGYSSVITGDAATGFTVTNTIEGKVSVGVTKKWVGPAAQKAVVTLLADGVEKETAELNEANNWQYTFTDLEKYNDGAEIAYTIDEVTVAGYSSVVTGSAAAGYVVTNTNDAKISIPVTKEWIGTAAASVTVKLLADGSEADTLTLTAADQWSGSFANLRKYDAADGHEIEYTLEEVSVDGYSSVITGDAATGFTVTNTIEGKVSVGVTKKWVGPAAEKAVIKLRADGVEKETAELNETNNWQYTFTDLEKYNNGAEIAYTIEETGMTGYIASVSGTAATGFIVTNINDERIDIPVVKEWVGPEADVVVIKLKADGVVVDNLTLTAASHWSGSFADLKKYDAADGHEIEYTLEEVGIDGYSSVITGDVTNGFTVTNTIEGKVSVGVTKKWVGPAAEKAVIKLRADGVEKETAELNETNNWQYTFTDLEKYNNGTEIAYTIEETGMTGYIASVSGTAATGFIVTNTNNAKITIPVAKAWVGPAAEKAVIKLKADGVVVDQLTLEETNNWSGSFADLKKYDAADGHEIEYTLEEVSIDGYSTVITGDVTNGFTVTNTIEGKVSVGVTKKWIGAAADKVEIVLLADGAEAASAELSAANNWQYTFEGLEKYNRGVEIVYSIREVELENYETTITGDMITGFVVTNTNVTRISIPVQKRWVGAPQYNITFNLFADGTRVATQTTEASKGWRCTFENLMKYDGTDGHEIVYTISENAVDGYTISITGSAAEGFTVTNTMVPSIDKRDPELPEKPKFSPKTGDNRLPVAVSLMAESLAGLYITMSVRRKKSEEK